jgi:hypothetical protein
LFPVFNLRRGLYFSKELSLRLFVIEKTHKSLKIFAARCQVIQKHEIADAESRRLSGGSIRREVNAAVNSAAGDFIGQCRKAPVVPIFTLKTS